MTNRRTIKLDRRANVRIVRDRRDHRLGRSSQFRVQIMIKLFDFVDDLPACKIKLSGSGYSRLVLFISHFFLAFLQLFALFGRQPHAAARLIIVILVVYDFCSLGTEKKSFSFFCP